MCGTELTMTDSPTLILGGCSPLARTLAARLAGCNKQRVVLVDRENPVPTLQNERLPMLGQVCKSLSSLSWHTLVEQQLVSGVGIDRDYLAWMVSTLGLLRPRHVLLCAAVREEVGNGRAHATALSTLTSELSLALVAVAEYFRQLEGQQVPLPRLVIAVSGGRGATDGSPLRQLVEALVDDLLGLTGERPRLVLLPRLLGAGSPPDLAFQQLLRRLLLGESVRFSADSGAVPHWQSVTEAAAQVEAIMQADAASGGHAEPTLVVPGRAADETYLALIVADELDRLLPDPRAPRTTLVAAAPAALAARSQYGDLADSIRLAVRWHAANASLLTRTQA
jgi:hypothetical protein